MYQRWPQRRPPGQGDAEEHRQRRRRQPGPSTATPAAATAPAARRTPRRTSTIRGGKSISAAKCPIDSIVVFNRTDDNLGKRLDGFTLKVLDDKRNVVFEKKKLPAPDAKARFDVGGESPERLIRRAAMNGADLGARQGNRRLQGSGAVLSRTTPTAHAAIEALLRIPAAYWPKEEAKPLLDILLRLHPQAPRRRAHLAGGAGCAATGRRAGLALALGPRPSRSARSWANWACASSALARVPDQMLFDKERLVVKAGKPVEIVFENNDLMPHNLVVTQPGSLEEIGIARRGDGHAARRARTALRARSSKKILFASRLLQPRDSQKLSFTAPTKPGIYPYVCTYPGHWRRMYGALYVVEDLDEYLADPEGYLAKHPLPIADELLKFNRPRKEWKFDELASAVEPLKHGRSFSNGKQMFQVASCVACHKFNGVGNEFGPDLTKLDPKQDKPVEILHDILEPSFRINEKYQSYVFETEMRARSSPAWSSRRRRTR